MYVFPYILINALANNFALPIISASYFRPLPHTIISFRFKFQRMKLNKVFSNTQLCLTAAK